MLLYNHVKEHLAHDCEGKILHFIQALFVIFTNNHFLFVFLHIQRMAKLLCTLHQKKAIINVFNFFLNLVLILTLLIM